ncbi:MAG TPA: L,D-transpeptidase [Candidatus Angelobacter sp.]|nr:L,D-transpeptidase [Candidatus Angelobacter sp.]
MRRLVAISGRTSKIMMALAAVPIALTSIHVAASARSASLRRQQEQLEKTARAQESAISAQQFALNQGHGLELALAAELPSAVAASHKRQIVISIADRKLALLEDGHLLKVYSIAVGTRGTPSPDGDFVIINHAKDPVYRHGKKEIAPGKDNPLGSRWMGLSLKGYGIHGTNVQSSVGKAASHGCFRMRKQDVEELYTLVRVGDTVTVRRERDAMIAQALAEPAAPAETLASQTGNSAEAQMAAANVATVETTQQ